MIKDDLIRDEGLRFRAYKDSEGIFTAGIGRNLQDVEFSQDEVDLMFNNDLNRAQIACNKLFSGFNVFSQNRQDALLNMAFNLGYYRLSNFVKMINAINKGRWDVAANEAQNSLWFTQVGDRGKRIIEKFKG